MVAIDRESQFYPTSSEVIKIEQDFNKLAPLHSRLTRTNFKLAFVNTWATIPSKDPREDERQRLNNFNTLINQEINPNPNDPNEKVTIKSFFEQNPTFLSACKLVSEYLGLKITPNLEIIEKLAQSFSNPESFVDLLILARFINKSNGSNNVPKRDPNSLVECFRTSNLLIDSQTSIQKNTEYRQIIRSKPFSEYVDNKINTQQIHDSNIIYWISTFRSSNDARLGINNDEVSSLNFSIKDTLNRILHLVYPSSRRDPANSVLNINTLYAELNHTLSSINSEEEKIDALEKLEAFLTTMLSEVSQDHNEIPINTLQPGGLNLIFEIVNDLNNEGRDIINLLANKEFVTIFLPNLNSYYSQKLELFDLIELAESNARNPQFFKNFKTLMNALIIPKVSEVYSQNLIFREFHSLIKFNDLLDFSSNTNITSYIEELLEQIGKDDLILDYSSLDYAIETHLSAGKFIELLREYYKYLPSENKIINGKNVFNLRDLNIALKLDSLSNEQKATLKELDFLKTHMIKEMLLNLENFNIDNLATIANFFKSFIREAQISSAQSEDPAFILNNKDINIITQLMDATYEQGESLEKVLELIFNNIKKNYSTMDEAKKSLMDLFTQVTTIIKNGGSIYTILRALTVSTTINELLSGKESGNKPLNELNARERAIISKINMDFANNNYNFPNKNDSNLVTHATSLNSDFLSIFNHGIAPGSVTSTSYLNEAYYAQLPYDSNSLSYGFGPIILVFENEINVTTPFITDKGRGPDKLRAIILNTAYIPEKTLSELRRVIAINGIYIPLYEYIDDAHPIKLIFNPTDYNTQQNSLELTKLTTLQTAVNQQPDKDSILAYYDLIKSVTSSTLSADFLINLLSSPNSDGRTIEQHTDRVVNNLIKVLDHKILDLIIPIDILTWMLFTHDLGKGRSEIYKSGSYSEEYSAILFEEVLSKLENAGYMTATAQQRKIGYELIRNNYIGHLLDPRLFLGKNQEERTDFVVNKINDLKNQLNLTKNELKKLLELALIYYICDAGAYETLASDGSLFSSSSQKLSSSTRWQLNDFLESLGFSIEDFSDFID